MFLTIASAIEYLCRQIKFFTFQQQTRYDTIGPYSLPLDPQPIILLRVFVFLQPKYFLNIRKSAICFQLQQIMTMNPGRRSENQTGGTMLRLLGAAQKREVKATQNLSRIVIFFIICWFPLYTINCIKAFCPDCEVSSFLLDFCIILSHMNSAGNPLLYAYHLKDFRAALKNFICRFLFPYGVTKASVISVINERNSVASNHNVNQIGATGCPSRARYAGSCAIQSTRLSVPSNGKSPRGFEATIFTPDSSPTYVREVDAFIDQNPSNEASPDVSERQNDEKLSNDNFSASGLSALATPPTPATPNRLELQTYRPFTHLFDSDGLSAESVFVIEADVSHCLSSRERLTSDDQRSAGAELDR